MGQNSFRCEKCGYTPRDSPLSGIWYCQKCGHRMKIANRHSHKAPTYYKKPEPVRTSRDQVYSQMYSKLTSERPLDIGYKEPYIKPNIDPIFPKRRDKIRLFYKR